MRRAYTIQVPGIFGKQLLQAIPYVSMTDVFQAEEWQQDPAAKKAYT
jgi:hypothetical protein